MNPPDSRPTNAAELIAMVERMDLPPIRCRDRISAITRICVMTGTAPSALDLDVANLRDKLAAIRPAAHQISRKNFANVRSLFLAALELGRVVDRMERGTACGHPSWG